MKHFITTHLKAKNLMTDDWFKIAGTLYRVKSVKTNAYGEKIIRFLDPAKPGSKTMTLIVPPKTFFKIYNRK